MEEELVMVMMTVMVIMMVIVTVIVMVMVIVTVMLPSLAVKEEVMLLQNEQVKVVLVTVAAVEVDKAEQ